MSLPPRWVVAVSVAVAAAILGDSFMYAVLPAIWPSLGLEVGMVGFLLSVNRLTRLGSNPLAGWVMGRYGQRGPFMASVFVAAVTTAAYALGRGFWLLALARTSWGVCWSFLRLGGYLAALEASTEDTRGYYLAFFNGVTRFGSFVAVLFGGLLTDILGFTATAYLFAGATAFAGVGLVRERPPQPAAEQITGVRDKTAGMPGAGRAPLRVPGDEPATGTAVSFQGRVGDTPGSLRLRRWTIYGIAFVDGALISGLATATLGLWLLTLFGATTKVFLLTLGVATLSGWLLSIRFFSDFGWGPVAGHLSDRFGRRPVILVAIAVESAAFVALSVSRHLLAVVASVLFLFLAATAFRASLDATAGDLAAPHQRARTMSWYATFIDLGAGSGPLLAYLLLTTFGLGWLYFGAAGVLLLAGVVYTWVFIL